MYHLTAVQLASIYKGHLVAASMTFAYTPPLLIGIVRARYSCTIADYVLNGNAGPHRMGEDAYWSCDTIASLGLVYFYLSLLMKEDKTSKTLACCWVIHLSVLCSTYTPGEGQECNAMVYR